MDGGGFRHTCSRVAEWALSWRARAALEARVWAWRWGRRWEMCAGGIRSRRSWIELRREAAFRSSSSAYCCCSGVNTTGSRSSSCSPCPLPPTTSAAHANRPAISISLSLSLPPPFDAGT